MGKLPQVSGHEVCKALEKEGFVFKRQTGSHRIYQKQSEEGAVTIPVPVHSSRPMNLPAASCGVSKTARNEASFGEFTLRELKKGTLLSILNKAGISKEKLIFLVTLFLQ
ncbi:MAG: type II toxin-antitoxin system HicA family toxin [Nitrospirota bacterium]|nr:type II toxin-antitoxin system HicA family toxin [Nitrospirota bacterium]